MWLSSFDNTFLTPFLSAIDMTLSILNWITLARRDRAHLRLVASNCSILLGIRSWVMATGVYWRRMGGTWGSASG